MINRHEKLAGIFSDAIALPVGERDAYVREACAEDSDLLARVGELLRSHVVAGEFLATPLAVAAAEVGPGARIGRYKLVENIGEGGIGSVFLAEQEEPFRRQVALKLIKPGMDTREIIARFESERQALALMDHPGIARVFDAGATASGRPFFVMELVHGPSITKFCDAEKLPLEARLELFVQVCQAIQHAHAKGIIHRDIKPPNILVVRQDGAPVPKVIDFGIAKATEFRLTEKTVVTAVAHFMGTPSYMSPEQAELGGRDIDARTDIYSLGMLLYELLTGRTPFDGRELAQAGLDEMRRRIREEEPARPSHQLGTLEGDKLAAVARLRATDPVRLVRTVRGDLDWIILRCLEKDRERRYPTASALAEDLRRYLRHERVSAAAPSPLHIAAKLLHRHRTAVLLGAAAVVTFMAIGYAWFAPRREALPVAANHPENAEVRRLVLEGRTYWNQRTDEGFARALVSYGKAIEIDPNSADAHAGLASTCVIREQYRLLDERPVTDDPSRARSEALLAIKLDPTLPEAYLPLAYGYFIDGQLSEAQRHFETSLGLNPKSAHAQFWYALLQSSQGKLDAALARLDEARVLDPRMFMLLHIRTWELVLAGRYEDALANSERAAALRSDIYIPSQGERARILLGLGRIEEAVAAARVVRQNPDIGPRWHADAVAVRVLQRAGLTQEAADYAAELFTKFPRESYRRGFTLVALGRFEEALPLLEKTPVVMWRDLYWDEMFARWRNDPRFQALLVKLGCAREYQVADANRTAVAATSVARRAGGPEVQRLMLEGGHYWSLRTPEGFDRAEAAFLEVTKLEPDWAEAYAGLAQVYVLREQYRQFDGFKADPKDLRAARAAAQHAIALDPSAAPPYSALGYAYYLDGELALSHQFHAQALARDPRNAVATGWQTMTFSAEGRLDQSIVGIRKSSELDPLWFMGLHFLAWELSLARRFDEALLACERGAALRPDVYVPNAALRGRLQLSLGQTAAALESARKVRSHGDLSPRWSGDVDALWILRQTGQEKEAADYAAELDRRLPPDSSMRGLLLAALGRFEDGRPYLERLPVAFRRYLYWDEIFDPVRNDPRFRQLLEKLGCTAEYARARQTLAKMQSEPAAIPAPVHLPEFPKK